MPWTRKHKGPPAAATSCSSPGCIQQFTALGDTLLQGNVEAARIAAVGRKYADEMWARLPPERQQGSSPSSRGGGSGGGSQGQVRWIVDKMLRNWW